MTKEEALHKIEELRQFIENEEKKPTKEERFLELINGCEIKIDKAKYPNSVFFFKGDKYFFEIEKQYLWCSYVNVWSVFESEFKLGYDEIKSLIKSMVEEHFKMKGVTPISLAIKQLMKVEEHFKMKGVTPELKQNK